MSSTASARRRCILRIAPVAVAAALTAAPLAAQQTDSMDVRVAELGARLRFLSSDLFEGREPGTRGDSLTVAYLVSELEAFGVRPGADGGWFQPVSIVVHRPDTTVPVRARLSDRVNRELEHGRDLRLSNDTDRPLVETGGELVFVGYGIVAPQYRWDDLAGVDLRGRVAVLLRGEPQLPGDTVRFNGRRASRHASMDEKLTELERRGAVGALLVVPGSGISRRPPSGSRRLADVAAGHGMRFVGGLADSALARLLPPGVRSLDGLVAAAGRPGFRARPLGVRLDVRFATVPSTVRSRNVVGVVPGRDPALAGEHVVLSAHRDAFGIGTPVDGDSIYNGALDDGSGVTALLALARVFAAHPQRRSITFLFTTAEEWGLLGAEAFVRSGPLPMGRVVANLNVDDGVELFGRKRDVAPLGVELSTLGDVVADVARRAGLRVSPDPFPEEGFFLRADNYPFAAAGVPALYMALGTEAVDRPAGWVEGKVKEYLERHYHQRSDEYDTVVVDLEGSRQFAEFVRDVTIAVANADERPDWRRGVEFRRPPSPASGATR